MQVLNNKMGFTLIELLVAVTIIGIIATVAIPTYLDYARNARMSDARTYAESLKPTVSQCIVKYTLEGSFNPETFCNGGVEDIPNDIFTPLAGTTIAQASVSNGVIYIQTSSGDWIALTPGNPTTTPGGIITWDCASNLQNGCPNP